jgi:glycerophosphoryl diester phosphodiesterase
VQTAFAEDSGATHAGIALDSMTLEFGDVLHHAGFKVFVYTADTTQQIKLAKELGVDGIISNFPERI